MSPRARLTVALALTTAAASVASGCHKTGGEEESDPSSAPVHVQCVAAGSATVPETRSPRGTVVAAPDRDAVIAPQVAGRLLRVLVREGDAVAANALVAEVEAQPTQDALTQARAQLAQATAVADNARVALARQQHLFERGIAPRQDVDDAAAHSAEAAAGVSAARATVSVAARNLARATVRTPIAGTVVRVLRRAGELVDGTPATPVLEVADPDGLEFAASAPPSDLVALRAGQRAEVRFDALAGRTFAATVRAVAPSIDPTTGVGAVRLALAPSEQRPPFGLFGVATVTVGEHADAVVVPQGALRGAGGADLEVVVCDNGHARARAVEVGARTGEQAEITRGLHAGERVVTEGTIGLADGAAIREGGEREQREGAGQTTRAESAGR